MSESGQISAAEIEDQAALLIQKSFKESAAYRESQAKKQAGEENQEQAAAEAPAEGGVNEETTNIGEVDQGGADAAAAVVVVSPEEESSAAAVVVNPGEESAADVNPEEESAAVPPEVGQTDATTTTKQPEEPAAVENPPPLEPEAVVNEIPEEAAAMNLTTEEPSPQEESINQAENAAVLVVAEDAAPVTVNPPEESIQAEVNVETVTRASAANMNPPAENTDTTTANNIEAETTTALEVTPQGQAVAAADMEENYDEKAAADAAEFLSSAGYDSEEPRRKSTRKSGSRRKSRKSSIKQGVDQDNIDNIPLPEVRASSAGTTQQLQEGEHANKLVTRNNTMIEIEPGPMSSSENNNVTVANNQKQIQIPALATALSLVPQKILPQLLSLENPRANPLGFIVANSPYSHAVRMANGGVAPVTVNTDGSPNSNPNSNEPGGTTTATAAAAPAFVPRVKARSITNHGWKRESVTVARALEVAKANYKYMHRNSQPSDLTGDINTYKLEDNENENDIHAMLNESKGVSLKRKQSFGFSAAEQLRHEEDMKRDDLTIVDAIATLVKALDENYQSNSQISAAGEGQNIRQAVATEGVYELGLQEENDMQIIGEKFKHLDMASKKAKARGGLKNAYANEIGQEQQQRSQRSFSSSESDAEKLLREMKTELEKNRRLKSGSLRDLRSHYHYNTVYHGPSGGGNLIQTAHHPSAKDPDFWKKKHMRQAPLTAGMQHFIEGHHDTPDVNTHTKNAFVTTGGGITSMTSGMMSPSSPVAAANAAANAVNAANAPATNVTKTGSVDDLDFNNNEEKKEVSRLPTHHFDKFGGKKTQTDNTGVVDTSESDAALVRSSGTSATVAASGPAPEEKEEVSNQNQKKPETAREVAFTNNNTSDTVTNTDSNTVVTVTAVRSGAAPPTDSRVPSQGPTENNKASWQGASADVPLTNLTKATDDEPETETQKRSTTVTRVTNTSMGLNTAAVVGTGAEGMKRSVKESGKGTVTVTNNTTTTRISKNQSPGKSALAQGTRYNATLGGQELEELTSASTMIQNQFRRRQAQKVVSEQRRKVAAPPQVQELIARKRKVRAPFFVTNMSLMEEWRRVRTLEFVCKEGGAGKGLEGVI